MQGTLHVFVMATCLHKQCHHDVQYYAKICLPECIAMTCSESLWSRLWSGWSSKTQRMSNLDSMAGLIFRFCIKVLALSYDPPAGFAAASRLVRAGKEATTPALAMLTSCCSNGPSRACTSGDSFARVTYFVLSPNPSNKLQRE